VSEKINDGGPAFPFVEPSTPCGITPGLSQRAWFAGQALAGMCANPFWNDVDCAGMAFAAVEHADAMIAAMNKREKESQ
jgi:hypothetical protein